MKKLNKLVAILVAMAMVLSLTVISAFATTSGTPASSEEQLSEAYLTKYLKIADGVAAPTVTFNFTVTPQNTSYTITEANPDYDSEDPESQETITRTITGRSAAEAGQALSAQTFTMTANQDATGSSKYGTKTISSLFDTFPGAGVYTYLIQETDSTLTQDSDDKTTEKINDNVNENQYTVRVYVKADGSKTYTITDEDGNKVIASQPTGTIDPDNPTGMNFVNTYEKGLVVDPEDPNSVANGVLNVKKTVSGDYADTKQQFPFTLKLTRASTDTTAGDTVSATIVRQNGSEVTPAGAVTITYGQDYEFTLANGEMLRFDTLPAGTKYEVTERLTDATATNKGSYVASSGAVTATKGADLELDQATLTEAAAVTVNNDLDDDDVTPTGILINNLPYIALALVAIGGLVAYVVVRRRQDDEA